MEQDVKVYTKKYIEEDQLWEENPHIAFLLYLAVYLILFFGGMFGLIFCGIHGFLLALYLIALTAGLVFVVIHENNMKNISKSIAFIKKNGELYLIKLGYMVDYQVYAKTDEERRAAVASQVQKGEIMVRNLRKKPEYFASALDIIHKTGQLPECVVEYLKMGNPKLEKETKNFIWISYDYMGERKIKKYRNAYGLELSISVRR